MEILKIVIETFRLSLLITAFVLTMMMLIEFLNILSSGTLSKWLEKGGIFQFVSVTLIATIPGCLGSFTAVSLFLHGVISRGILVGSMIASSGDEAFIMVAMMPKMALVLFLFLLFYGIFVGTVIDKVFGKKLFLVKERADELVVHSLEKESYKRVTFTQWSFVRIFLLLTFLVIFVLVIFGFLGEKEWNWERFALIASSLIGFSVILFASDHFIEEHLLKHILKKHLLKLFLWTFFALLAMEIIKVEADFVHTLIKNHQFYAIVIAALIGILPESGPHLIFVMGFVNGIMPFSTLVASSVVQDGHGMLPLLAESPKEFIKIKSINFVAGVLAGVIFMLIFP